MTNFGQLWTVLLSLALLKVHGLPSPAGADLTPEKSTSTGDTLNDNLEVEPWDPPFPGVEFGPSIGVKYDEIVSHPKNFDDKYLLKYDSHYHRELRQISCYYKQGQLIGLEELYTLYDGSAPRWTNYRGYDPTPHDSADRNLYVLQKGEHWSGVDFKICGRKITGINFKTSAGRGVSCGDYHAIKNDGCYASTLKPAKGRKIIALYGDANGRYFTPRKGIRGIGITTYRI
ncbi:protein of unknown function [Taphrina deformans PYCC 5710]|uniref:Jacalin-type lectin domain-containing protein n=1 Tax=Taphrina deformans (strain PYCC 5710 / ATCC 11124 / CBS 356.35 / IMI 108563 / JCM 9778 / NBRC 8474) TaxID=1097556 RepID=R4XDG7_TAPDE|nr:protein of unknown function [Taphrina deformans PYCC 5710]|eukprot:CCG82453.1 protein of unknown function [Taphrina deformans PYCC 5710]